MGNNVGMKAGKLEYTAQDMNDFANAEVLRVLDDTEGRITPYSGEEDLRSIVREIRKRYTKLTNGSQPERGIC